MNTIICIQARTSSSRLPGKVLKPLAGATLLERMIERVKAATITAEIVVLTSHQSEDDPIVQIAQKLGVRCFRGHLTDLLDRHYQAAVQFEADTVAKIPSDCPLIDPQIIRTVFDKFNEGGCDYVSNLHPATYPDGNDVEIFTSDALEEAWRDGKLDYEREHTTPFMWEQPERFRIGNVEWESGLDLSMTHRWTIDYPEDYEFIRSVYDRLWSPEHSIFTMEDILELLAQYPELAAINAKYVGVNWYRHHLGSLQTIGPEQTKILEPNSVLQ